MIEIKVPDIGDFDEVAVIELLVKPGDSVKAEQSLITVESDKASMEIPSSHAGVVRGTQGQARGQGQRRLGRCCSRPKVPPLAPAALVASAAPAAAPAPVAAVVPAPVAAPAAAGPVELRVPDIGDFGTSR